MKHTFLLYLAAAYITCASLVARADPTCNTDRETVDLTDPTQVQVKLGTGQLQLERVNCTDPNLGHFLSYVSAPLTPPNQSPLALYLGLHEQRPEPDSTQRYHFHTKGFESEAIKIPYACAVMYFVPGKRDAAGRYDWEHNVLDNNYIAPPNVVAFDTDCDGKLDRVLKPLPVDDTHVVRELNKDDAQRKKFEDLYAKISKNSVVGSDLEKMRGYKKLSTPDTPREVEDLLQELIR